MAPNLSALRAHSKPLLVGVYALLLVACTPKRGFQFESVTTLSSTNYSEITVDPDVSFRINDGSPATGDTQLNITINSGSLHVINMKMSENSECTGGSWQSFQVAHNFNITDGEDGPRDLSLALEFLEKNTSRTLCLKKKIILDREPPDMSISSPLYGTIFTTRKVNLTVRCETGLPVTSSGAGVSTTSENCENGSATLPLILTPGNGNKSFVVKQADLAGNSNIRGHMLVYSGDDNTEEMPSGNN